MKNRISFDCTVKESSVSVNIIKNENGDLVEAPTTTVTLQLDNHDPRVGSFIGTEKVSVTISNGD